LGLIDLLQIEQSIALLSVERTYLTQLTLHHIGAGIPQIFE
jgi:hypothetical protein